jgi:3-oxoadipate enol-lactonase
MVAGEYAHYQDLRVLLDYLAIDKAHLIGCSKGGAVIIDFALAYPDRVGTLIPVATALYGYQYTGEPLPLMNEINAAEEAGDIDQLNELEIRLWIDGPKRRPDQVNPLVRQKVLDMNRIGLMTPPDLGTEKFLEPYAAERVHELKCPLQLIVGELDVPKTIHIANLMTVKVPCAKKVVFPCVAHLPNMEEPSLFNTVVLKYLHDCE